MTETNRRKFSEDMEDFKREGLDPERRRRFRASERAVREWERAHPQGLDSILPWIEGLRLVFGDPPVDRRRWRGSDFRL